MSILVNGLKNLLIKESQQVKQLACLFHTTNGLNKYNTHNKGPKKFLKYNKTVFPPQQPDEEPRKAVSKMVKVIKNTKFLSIVHFSMSAT